MKAKQGIKLLIYLVILLFSIEVGLFWLFLITMTLFHLVKDWKVIKKNMIEWGDVILNYKRKL